MRIKLSITRQLLIILIAASVLIAQPVFGSSENLKKILILYEYSPTPYTSGLGDAKQLRQLLGHFRTDVTVKSVDSYKSGEIKSYDFAFYIGYNKKDIPPNKFLRDAYETEKPLVWLNTGMEAFSRQFNLEKRFGFTYLHFDTTSVYDLVEHGKQKFTKTEPNANVVKITDSKRCIVLAKAISTKKKTIIPYIIRSNNFWYVADSPFSYATESDRYLLFSDMLHDILEENHPYSHSALIRIEDTNPFSNPAQLRAVADVLYDRNIPFLVGVTPYYVNPANGIRIAMSDKPDYIDALHYMMEHGGTIVLHGTTHQYKGETAIDYEYWDESRDKPIPVDSKEYVERRMKDGISECIKNGVYPLVWETPHYSASSLDYSVFAKHFSTAVEQRLVLDRLDQSQYFPYIIYNDMFGQKIYPENLGYIPSSPNKDEEIGSVDRAIYFAKINLAVRDGFATVFFHPFLDTSLLERLVDGIQALGYKYIDLRESTNVVKLDDKVIVSGNSQVALTFNERYMREIVLNDEGEIVKNVVSPNRFKGIVRRNIKLDPKWIYVAEATEYYERTLTFFEKVKYQFTGFVQKTIKTKKTRIPANVLLLYDPDASGGAYNDQMSFKEAFRTLNIPVDALPVNQDTKLEISSYNCVIVPYNVAELLDDSQVEYLKSYVRTGGNLITDFRNTLAAEIGIRFFDSAIQVDRVRDSMFPDELLKWNRSEVMNRFDTMRYDEVMGRDDKSDTPVVIGRHYGDGKFIFFGTRFDPLSTAGYSRYPYLIHHIQRFFSIYPVLRRDQLEIYFDPGFRHTISIEQLVSIWASTGIRIIHVAGWHEYPKYKYDYKRLIRLCHSNGILVYAWLEPPQISKKFWTEHPEWREKNFKGEDIRPSWRYPVALTDPACLDAVLKYYKNFMDSYDWDGVNIAELYFEAGRGMKDSKLMTPFHKSARNQFKKIYGFDPVELFDPNSVYFWNANSYAFSCFTSYRIKEIAYIHERILFLIDSVRKTKPWVHVVVTVMDSLSAPELRINNGIDVNKIISLKGKYPFLIQIEDPQSMWSSDPRRYESIANRYTEHISPGNFALDLNILSFREDNAVTPFPTKIQTGTESYLLLNSAARGAHRVTIYCESSINPQDLSLLPYAYSAGTEIKKVDNRWIINAPTPVVLQLDPEVKEIKKNGRQVLSIGEGKFLLPRGSYQVTIPQRSLKPFQTDILKTRILSITGELLSEKSSQRSVEFKYRSENRCIVTFPREPFAVFLDNQETHFKALKGNGRYALILPSGEHHVLVVAQSDVSYGVDITSLWSSSLIVLFGIAAGGLLIIFYGFVRIKYH